MSEFWSKHEPWDCSFIFPFSWLSTPWSLFCWQSWSSSQHWVGVEPIKNGNTVGAQPARNWYPNRFGWGQLRFDLKWGTYKNYRLSTTAAATTTTTTTTHNQQPTTNNQQPPTTNHQPPTTNHQPPTTNHQPPPTTTNNNNSQCQEMSRERRLQAWQLIEQGMLRQVASPGRIAAFAGHLALLRVSARIKKKYSKATKKILFQSKKKVVSPTAATFFTDLSEVCCEAKRWKHLLRNPVEPLLALHQSLPGLLRNLLRNPLNLTWLCTKASWNLLRNLLRNPVEPDLALH